MPAEAVRSRIAGKVRRLRKERRWTQAELASSLGLSQNRLSEIERGQGSFTAEQFLTILKLFNVSVTHFAPEKRRGSSELQNALARLGAAHLHETDDVLPSELLDEAASVVREVLASVGSPRHLTSLASVLVRNIDRINLQSLYADLAELGLQQRFSWLLDNTLEALRQELSQDLPRKWIVTYRRAELLLNAFLSFHRARHPQGAGAAAPDILDPNIVTNETLAEVRASASAASRRWGVATSLQPDDFVEALRASRVAS